MKRSILLICFALFIGIAPSIARADIPPWINSTGAGVSPLACDKQAVINVSTAVTVELVPAVTGKTVYVCGFIAEAAGTTNITFKTGTKTTNPCDTAAASLSGPFSMTAQNVLPFGSGLGLIMQGITAGELCLTNSGAIQVSGILTYAQY